MTEIDTQAHNVYYAIKTAMLNQSNNQLLYPSQNFIPNKLKTCEDERQFLIRYFEPNHSIQIRDFIHRNADLKLHIASGTCKCIVSTNRPYIYENSILHSHKSYKICKLLLQNHEVLIATNKYPTIIAFDILTPIKINGSLTALNEIIYNYKPTKEDMKWRQSFTRNPLTIAEIQSRLIILDAEFARSTENKSIPVSVTLLDYKANIIINTLTYPRQKIRNYETRFHGLKEEHLIGKMDSEQIKRQVQMLVKDKILVGSDLQGDIQSLGIDVNQLCGIRDLSNALIIRDKTGSINQLMKLKDIAQIIIHEDIQESFHTAEEDARTILKIYKKVEMEWKDHSGSLISDKSKIVDEVNTDEFVFEEPLTDEFLLPVIQPDTLIELHVEESIDTNMNIPKTKEVESQTKNNDTIINLNGPVSIRISPDGVITIIPYSP